MEIISSNIANARTTDAGKGEPYRRLEARLKTQKDEISGVQIEKITSDMSDFERILDPGNPRADENGYVQHAQRELTRRNDEPVDCDPDIPGQRGGS